MLGNRQTIAGVIDTERYQHGHGEERHPSLLARQHWEIVLVREVFLNEITPKYSLQGWIGLGRWRNHPWSQPLFDLFVKSVLKIKVCNTV